MTTHGQFTFYAQRDWSDDWVTVHCDVVDIQEPEPNVGIRGYSVEIGDTWDSNGKSFPLSELEIETAQRQAAEALGGAEKKARWGNNE